jgi:hypothetical protein
MWGVLLGLVLFVYVVGCFLGCDGFGCWLFWFYVLLGWLCCGVVGCVFGFVVWFLVFDLCWCFLFWCFLGFVCWCLCVVLVGVLGFWVLGLFGGGLSLCVILLVVLGVLFGCCCEGVVVGCVGLA